MEQFMWGFILSWGIYMEHVWHMYEICIYIYIYIYVHIWKILRTIIWV